SSIIAEAVVATLASLDGLAEDDAHWVELTSLCGSGEFRCQLFLGCCRLHRDGLIEIEARRHLRILNRVALTALLTPPGDCLLIRPHED
ncbi:hypothetical protein, partial [Thiomonas sp.]